MKVQATLVITAFVSALALTGAEAGHKSNKGGTLKGQDRAAQVSNKGGALKGLDRADAAAGPHGAAGRAKARAAQNRDTTETE